MRTERKEGTIAIELDFSPILSIKEKQRDVSDIGGGTAPIFPFRG